MQDQPRFPVPRGYVFLKHLGRGPMGCSEIVRSMDGRIYVCKEIIKERIGNMERIQRFKERIDHIKTLRSPFVIPYVDLVEDETRIILIRQYFKNGALLESQEQLALFPHNKLFAMWSVLARTIYHLHQHHIGPNFIRPNNLFFYNGTCIVITDLYPSPADVNLILHSMNPTDLCFLAPEFFTQKYFPDTQADIWSLGVILTFLVTGEIPFNTKNVFSMITEISSCTMNVSKPIPSDIYSVIHSCMEIDPKKRSPIPSLINIKEKEEKELDDVVQFQPMAEAIKTGPIPVSLSVKNRLNKRDMEELDFRQQMQMHTTQIMKHPPFDPVFQIPIKHRNSAIVKKKAMSPHYHNKMFKDMNSNFPIVANHNSQDTLPKITDPQSVHFRPTSHLWNAGSSMISKQGSLNN